MEEDAVDSGQEKESLKEEAEVIRGKACVKGLRRLNLVSGNRLTIL